MQRNSTSFPQQLREGIDAIAGEIRADDRLRFYQRVPVEYLLDPRFGVTRDSGRESVFATGTPDATRGLLLYHQMGMGKTLAAAIMACKLSKHRPVVFCAPKGLHPNFEDTIRRAAVIAGMDPEAVVEKLTFVSSDAYNASEQLTKKLSDGGNLEGVALVVDEAHKLFESAISVSDRALEDNEHTGNARRIYNKVMATRDIVLVFLTGTPSAKNPFSLVPCFNMLAGKELLPTSYEVFSSVFALSPDWKSVPNGWLFVNRIAGMVSYASYDDHATGPEPPSLDQKPEEQETPQELSEELKTEEVKVIEDLYVHQANSQHEVSGGAALSSEFPEVLGPYFEKIEMTDPQYASYIDAREREERDAKMRAMNSVRPKRAVNNRMALPNSDSRGSYNVLSRTLSNVAVPTKILVDAFGKHEVLRKRQSEMDFTKIPASAFDHSVSPKMARSMELIEQAHKELRVPALFYSSFTGNAGIATFERFAANAGWTEWAGMNPEMSDADAEALPRPSELTKVYAKIIGSVDQGVRARLVRYMRAAVEAHDPASGPFYPPIGLVMTSSAGALGIDIPGLRLIVKCEPPWDAATSAQIDARGIRAGGVRHLPADHKTVAIYNLIAVANPTCQRRRVEHHLANPDDPYFEEASTIDETIFDRSWERERRNAEMRKLLKAASIEELAGLLKNSVANQCVADNRPLFRGTLFEDLARPNPRRPMVQTQVQAKLVTVDEVEYAVVDTPTAPMGVRLFERDVEVLPNNPLFFKIATAVAK